MNAFRPIGIINAKLSSSYVSLADFNDDKYDAVALYADKNDRPLIVCASKSCEPARYRVIYGQSVCFFTSFKDVQNFCEKHNYKMIKEGGRR